MFAVNYTLLFWAELHVSSGLAAVLQGTIPIFGMMFAHWMLADEPLRLQKLAGADCIGRCDADLLTTARVQWPACFLGRRGSRCWSRQRCVRQRARQGPVHATCSRNVGGMADDFRNRAIVIAWPRRRWKPTALSLDCTSVFCLLYLAVIGSALTFLLLYWLLPRLTVAQLQSISLITPPGAVMLGWLIGGEIFPLSSLLGTAFVLAGVWMIFRRPEMPAPMIQEG